MCCQYYKLASSTFWNTEKLQ